MQERNPKQGYAPSVTVSGWVLTLVLMGVLLSLVAGCTGETPAAVEPAADRPTFVWIFADP